MQFPDTRPKRGSFMRPLPKEVLDISPPGFCWWRAAERGRVGYRLRILDANRKAAYESPLLDDPVHVPDRVLPAGNYAWTVEAVDAQGQIQDELEEYHFSIAPNAYPQPWVEPAKLLAQVPDEHPRLLFPASTLDEVRATLTTTRKEAFAELKRAATRALKLDVPAEPDYDQIPERSERRMAYMTSYAALRKYHQGGMLHMALLYMLTGQTQFGEKAKALLLGAAEWDPEGVSSVMAPHGDEVGLGLARSAAQTYDWVHDLLSDEEKDKAKRMLIARADQMLRRLTTRDFLAYPETSHDGRLPGYLIEHAIALAEEPRARAWLDYAMRTLMTVFPHWAGGDGGWAEGVPYGLAYNTIYLTPFEELHAATGFDLWQRPFYCKVRRFFMYNISPLGEIMPFGDTEQARATDRASGIRALIQFHALKYQDAAARWWVDQLRTSAGRRSSISALPGIILPETPIPDTAPPMAPDAAFFGVGWAVLHSAVQRPDRDLMFMFKSSPYGGVSHSHADQNSFAIMKGGHALAIPGGERYPTHGSPFHTEYAQQTLAHNALLIGGRGQVNRDASRGGRLTDFHSTAHLGYACGDAANCYQPRPQRYRRHVLMVRPSVVIIVDDLKLRRPETVQWLLHTRAELELDGPAQTLVSRRDPERMKLHLIADGKMRFSQTDEWPVDPRKGYPTTRKKLPETHWHFTAETPEPLPVHRIIAVMLVAEDGAYPECELRRSADALDITVRGAQGDADVRVALTPGSDGGILQATYRLRDGTQEVLVAPEARGAP